MQLERDRELIHLLDVWIDSAGEVLHVLVDAGLEFWRADSGLWFWRWGLRTADYGLASLKECIADAIATRYGLVVAEPGVVSPAAA